MSQINLEKAVQRDKCSQDSDSQAKPADCHITKLVRGNQPVLACGSEGCEDLSRSTAFSRINLILLAGGTGSRMQTATPKQFLPLNGKLIIHYSLELFLSIPEIKEIVIVSDPQYRNHLTNYPVSFALPGARRQDSVYNGLMAISSDTEYVCIHDGARPFITKQNVDDIILAAKENGAATLGMPIKFTVKECDENLLVKHTPNRGNIWEIQTPQVIRYDILTKGFEQINREGLTVTDDVSVVEHIGHPVKLVSGSYNNLKITTPGDLSFSEHLLNGPFAQSFCPFPK